MINYYAFIPFRSQRRAREHKEYAKHYWGS